MKKSFWKNTAVQSLLASLICIVLGLLIGYIVLLFINPAGAGQAILAVIKNFLNLIQTNLNKEGRGDSSVAIYICGNDPTLDKDYYRQQLSTLNGPLSIETPSLSFPDGNPGEDLCLLSQCDYLIGPPSTFTLAAAMYQGRPLYWIKDISQPLTEKSFGYFDDLFQHII